MKSHEEEAEDVMQTLAIGRRRYDGVAVKHYAENTAARSLEEELCF